MYKEGDTVKITTLDDEFEGILLPEEDDFLVLKFDSGYNIGISKKRVKSIRTIEAKKKAVVKKKSVSQKKGLPKVSVLHTGGTIASKVDYETGGVTARFTPEELLEMFEELKDFANISSRLVRNMFSEDMRFAHYNVLANEVKKEIENGAEGVIITHGTDTLHYTAAALSFILEGLRAPVILVGAQRSSDRGSSDASLNLLSAVYFITSGKFGDVGICMHESISDEECFILPAMKTRKMHSARRDAFKAINTVPWAKINFKEQRIDFLKTDYRKRAKSKIKIMPINDSLRVGFVKAHPSFHAETLQCFKKYDGLLLEGTGLGHFPINEIDADTIEHRMIAKVIAELAEKIPVVMSTQTIYGEVNMNVYTTGRKLKEAGVIGDYSDMTPETSYIKLAWLLSNYPGKVREFFSKNFRGELNSRLEEVE